MSMKAPLIAALALTATLGATITASADSAGRTFSAPAISKAMAPCQVEPCNTGLPDFSTKHGRAMAPAGGVGTGTPDAEESLRWPWKKKNKERLKFTSSSW